jgi:cyclopropane fatty-acyl-phospholipid synthase-like methyltransferase
VGRRAPAAEGEEALSADPFRFTTIAHAGRDVLGPVSVGSWDGLLAQLPRDRSIRNVLDVGCGKAELLVRTLEHTGASGVGVEPNPSFAADARARIARRLVPGRGVVLEAELGSATIPKHKFDLGICTGAIHVFGEWRDALRAMAPLVSPNGWALMAPTYWQRPPHPDYLAAIYGDVNEAQSLPATLAAAEDAGWHVTDCHASTPEEWDDYEHSYAASMRRWCDENPDAADAGAFRERIEKWAEAYERWGRDTMGYAVMLLRRMG